MTRTAAPTNSRTRGITAIIEGFFAAGWFGWGTADAPQSLVPLLSVGQIVAVLVVLGGIVTVVRSRGQRTPMADPAVRGRYNMIVFAEFAILGAGALTLSVAGLSDWTAVWICAGVGLHFVPLARLFTDLWLVPLAAAVTTVAGVALIVGLTTDTAPSTVTGVGAGLCLLLAAVASLVGADRSPDSIAGLAEQP
ncbi:hypothetical protein [Rhodococcus sp. ACT016]|uniref:hypothetical protein n=1 Tax=Rhodococcus sp. ACT016 TaxID=3134808 RepID=UPI003D294871